MKRTDDNYLTRVQLIKENDLWVNVSTNLGVLFDSSSVLVLIAYPKLPNTVPLWIKVTKHEVEFIVPLKQKEIS